MRYLRAVLTMLIAMAPCTAWAGPPYVTDDPEPTPYRHFEIYAFSQGVIAPASMDGEAAGLEVNYGALPDLQLSASLPVGFSAPARENVHFGVSKIELGAKYRFVEEDEQGWRPQISFYPSAEFSLSRDSAEDGATQEFLPLWAQKSFGAWSIFGGGGIRLHPGPDGRASWLAGLAVTRAITPALEIGVEAVHQSAETRRDDNVSEVNLGITYALARNTHLVASAGPVITAGKTYSYYLGLEWAI